MDAPARRKSKARMLKKIDELCAERDRLRKRVALRIEDKILGW